MPSQNSHETLLDGEVTIYTRDGNKKSTYQVRFVNVLSDSPRYIRASLKTANHSLAIERALAMYRDHHNRAFLGLKSSSLSIDQLVEAGIRDFKPVAAKMVRNAHRAYWSIFMDGEDLSKWTTENISEYFIWRIKTQVDRPAGRYFKPSDDTVSVGTLKLERNILRKLFQIAYKKNLIAKVPGFPDRLLGLDHTHRIPSKERRGRFGEEYRTVSQDFRSIRRALNRKSLQPHLDPSSGTFKSWSNVNGNSSSKRLKEHNRWIVKSRPRFNRAQYWFVCLLIANTGIRPSEVVQLRHSDIRIRRSSDDGKYYTVIQIDSEVSKVRTYRDVIAQDFHATFERYLDYKREIEFFFNRKPQDADWLFPKQSDYFSRVNRLNNIVRPNLQRIGLHKSNPKRNNNIQTYYSAYSFRAYYITQRLKSGLDIYTLAKNCGVSIQTLSKTYDYNENWAFRTQMTAHLKKWDDSRSPKYDLETFTDPWET